MNIEEFVRKTYQDVQVLRPYLWCNDGFGMSVQGGRTEYSYPRENSPDFLSMEIGNILSDEELFHPYKDEKHKPYNKTVYGYVPIEIIQQVIEKHGGIDIVKTFKL